MSKDGLFTDAAHKADATKWIAGCTALAIIIPIYTYSLLQAEKSRAQVEVKKVEAFKACIESTKQPEACKKAVP